MDYYCDECRNVIREKEVYTHYEESEAWGHPVYEKWLLCPECREPLREYYNGEEDD